MKRHGVLFTSLSSRAIHLETANSLNTSSFLDALRRFPGRPLPVQQLHSNCATNIVGIDSILKSAFDEMDNKNWSVFTSKGL